MAQEPNRAQVPPTTGPAPAAAPAPAATQPSPAPEGDTVFHRIGRWLDKSISDIGSQFKDAQGKIDKFNHDTQTKIDKFGQDAEAMAKSTADGAKSAADAVSRIPSARAVDGRERCVLAPNGAPDCIAAANAICKAKGFSEGKSLDMTTAEKCPPKVLLSGRQGTPGECTTETFVSRALCQ